MLRGKQHTRENDIEQNTEKKGKTGAKKALGYISLAALVGALAFGSYKYAKGDLKLPNIFGPKDEKLATSLIEEYTVDDVFYAPDSVIINRAYDIKYCDGEALANAVNNANVKYCEIFDEYYTSDGRDIAIVTLEGERVETVDATKVDLDGVIIYMPPAGYELEGDKAVRVVKETVVRIVPKSADGDYSSVALDGVREYEITSVDERSTKTFSEMYDMVLIVDVPDNAVLVNNQCEGALNLVPKIK